LTSTLHIVLSCTNRKRVSTGTYPRLRDVRAQDLDSRAAAWIDHVSAAPTVSIASSVYAGEYWRTGLGLATSAEPYFKTTTWVLSAGLGLINVDDAIPAYGATLSGNHPDSVVAPGYGEAPPVVRKRWWSALAAWSGPAGGEHPRRLSDLAADPQSAIVVCAGAHYLEAVGEDLANTFKSLRSNRLLIFGSERSPVGLELSWIRVPGQLRLRFSGSMSSTGVRTASAVIRELGPSGLVDAPRARDLVASWSVTTSPLPRFERTRLSDEHIAKWIVDDFDANGRATNRTVALRRLRDQGIACEQGRFGRLYDEVVSLPR
jgi:hypothetical protein